MANKVIFGLENVHIAFMNTEAPEQPAWKTPVKIPGAVSFSPSPEGDENTFYADNGPYFKVTTNNGYTAELEMALIPDDVLAEMMGWRIDSNGMLVENADAMPKEFALLGEVKGDSKNRRFVYYRCTAARSDEEHNTQEDTITPDTTTLTITILPINIGGENVIKGVIELSDTNATAFNAFFGSVLVPAVVTP